MNVVTVNNSKYLKHEFASKQLFIDIFGPKKSIISPGKGFFKIYGEKVIYHIKKEDLISKVESIVRDAKKLSVKKYNRKINSDEFHLSKTYPLKKYIIVLRKVFGNFFAEEIAYDIAEDMIKKNIQMELAAKKKLFLQDILTEFAELTTIDTVNAQVLVIANEIALNHKLNSVFLRYGPSHIMGFLEEYPEISKQIIELSKKYYYIENDFLEVKRLSVSYWISKIQTQLKITKDIEEEVHNIYSRPKEIKNQKIEYMRKLQISRGIGNQILFLDFIKNIKAKRELILACEIGKLDFLFRQIALRNNTNIRDFYNLNLDDVLELSNKK